MFLKNYACEKMKIFMLKIRYRKKEKLLCLLQKKSKIIVCEKLLF